MGTQYRSTIFCLTNQQKELANLVVEEMETSVYSGMKIVTEIILIPGGKDEISTEETVSSAFWKEKSTIRIIFLKMGTFPIASS